MIFRRVILLAIVLAILPALPAGARPVGPLVGIGEQRLPIFSTARWRQLGLHDARYIVPWDAFSDPPQLALLDAYMANAGKHRVRVLLGFSHSVKNKKLAKKLPSVKQFAKEFQRFRARYPWVKDWIVWNEANNGHSLTGRKPKLVAQYYNAVVRRCPGCRIVGADVEDLFTTMTWWITQFKRYARPYPRYWGLHNYVDTNYFRSRGTLRMLALTRGKIWFTETGGVVYRRQIRGGRVVQTFRWGPARAAAATRQVFRLACLSPRITRVYLYHWRETNEKSNWDSALLDKRGRPRPAYYVLKRWVAASAQASRRGGRSALCRARI